MKQSADLEHVLVSVWRIPFLSPRAPRHLLQEAYFGRYPGIICLSSAGEGGERGWGGLGAGSEERRGVDIAPVVPSFLIVASLVQNFD